MLEYFRARAAEAMAEAELVALATCGPAGLQSDALPCRALNQVLYLLVPRTSDQLLNIEHCEDVLVTAQKTHSGAREQPRPAQAGHLPWQLRGRARILSDADTPAALRAEQRPEVAWSVWVEVTPLRLTLLDMNHSPFETIDF